MFNFYKKDSRWLRVLPVAIAMSLVSSIWTHAATFYSKAASTDFTAVGSWGANTDGSGAAPASISNADDFIIANGSVMNLNSGSAAVRTLTINAGSLTVGSNTLTVSLATTCTSNLTVNTGGTLTVSGGAITINGRFLVAGTATLNQSGGTITVDGNDAGNAANSVGSGLGIITFSSSVAPNLTGGTLICVDPHANTTASFAFDYNSAATCNSAAAHTFQFGNGVSTDAGGNATNGFRHSTWTGASRFLFGNLVINALAGTNRYITSQWSHGMRSLTVTSGDYRTTSTPCAVEGNISVAAAGTLTANSTLQMSTYLGGTSGASANAQTISGAGTFRNLAAAPTANFTNLTINNSNAAGVTMSGNSLTGTGTGTVSGTLTFTTGRLTPSGGTFILGISTTTAGTLTATSGGFTSGSTFRRWVGTNFGSVFATPTTSFFPFVEGANNRNVRLNRFTGATNTAGWVQATYTSASGLTPSVFTDGAYNVQQRTNASWAFSSGGGFNVTGSLALGLSGEGLIVTAAAPGNAPRLVQSGVAAGTHVAGSGTSAAPFANRTLSLGQFIATHYIGIATADIGLYSIASGAWENPAIWSTGSAPTASDNPLISTGTTVTVSASPANATSISVSGTLNITGNTSTVTGSAASTGITVGASGALNVSAGTLDIGLVGNVTNNRSLIVNGTFGVTGGNVNIYGNLVTNNGSSFSQSGGTIEVDGNAGGVALNSVASGTDIVRFNTLVNASHNFTGGTFIITDPHASASNTFTVNSGTAGAITASGTHTFQFGSAASTDAGSASGFIYYSWNGNGIMQMRNAVLAPVTGGANRFVSLTGSFHIFAASGDITVGLGAELRSASTSTTLPPINVGGNLTNNGTITNPSILAFGNAVSATGTTLTLSASTTAQAVGGTGVYQNALVPTAMAVGLRIENTSVGGITFNIPFTQNGALNMINGKVNTTSTNVLTHIKTGAAGNVFIGTGTAAYVSGPFRMTIPASFTNAACAMPVGKTAPNWITFFNVVTNAGGSVTLQAERNNSIGLPNTNDLSLISLTAGAEWVTSIVSGAANLTSFSSQIYDPAIASGNVQAAIQTPATDFSAFGSGSTFVAGAAPLFNALALNIPPIAGTAFPDRIAIGQTGPLAVTTVSFDQTAAAAFAPAVARGTTNNNIGRFNIPALGSIGTVALTDLNLTYTGTAPETDITEVSIWTGTFAAPVALVPGATAVFSGGNATFTGISIPINSGNNFIWVRCNVSATAALGTTIDFQLNSNDLIAWTLTGGATAASPLPVANLLSAGSTLIDYCSATYSTGCVAGADGISLVNLAGSSVTLNNASACAAGPGYYTYYPAVNKPDLQQGSSYPISITMGSDGTQYSRVWVDFDQNGVLDAGESFSAATNAGANGTSTFNIVVPGTATLGFTRMRVRGGDDAVITSAVACGASASVWGETEDYIVEITNPTPSTISGITASHPSTAGMAPSTTNNNLVRVAVSVSGSLGTLTLNQIRFTYTGTSAADIAASGVSLWTGTITAPTAQIGTSQSISGGLVNFTGLTSVLNPGVNYLWMRVNTSASAVVTNLVDASIASGDITISATGGAVAPGTQPPALEDPVGSRFIDYCTPVYATGCTSNDMITAFSINTLNNPSGTVCAPGTPLGYIAYAPAGALTTTLTAGVTYTANLSIASGGGAGVAIWIDYNKNGVFDAAEKSGTVSNIASGGSGTITVIVPSSTLLGTMRMRVRHMFATTSTSIDACNAGSSFGETEDYTITMLPPPDCNTLLPFPASATTASTASVCNGASITFGLTVPMPNGANITYQLQRNGVDQGAAQTAVPFTHTVTTSGNWGIVVKCTGTTQLTASTVALTVISPLVTPGPAVTRCGPGTLSPTASSITGGATLRWYNVASGGTEVSSGPSPNTYVTNSLPAPSTQTYYVESSVVLGSSASGPADPAIGAFAAGIAPGAGIYQEFSTSSGVTIQTIDVYPIAAGDLVVELRNSANVVQATATRSITAGEANSTGSFIGTPVTMTLNFNVGVGTGWRLVFLSGPTCIRNSSGAAPSYGVATAGLTHTGNWFADNNYWYYGFNWQLEGRCASSRSSVLATVTTPPTLSTSVSSATICDGLSTNLGASGGGYTNYSWTPGSLTGSSQTVSPTATTTYVVTATGGGCNNSASRTVTVLPTPTNPVVVPSTPGGRCLGQNKTLTTSSTTAGTVSLLSETFNTGTLASLGWTQSTTGTTVPWNLVTAPHNYLTQITNFSVTNPGSSFVICNSDADINSLGNTSLISPSFSTVGRTTVTVSFDHVLRYLTGDIARVEYTTDGGTVWTPTSLSFTATTPAQTWVAGAIQTTNSSVNLPAGALNQANVRIRFFYDYSYSYYWMIDNVSITANDFVSYRWSDNTGFGGIPAPQQVFSPSNSSAVVTPTQGGPITYTVQVTNSVGCNAFVSGTHSFNVSDVVVAAASTGPQRVGTTLTLSATPSGGFGGYSYQWFKQPNVTPPLDVINSGAGFSTVNAQVTNSGTYQVNVTDGTGCTATSTVEALVYAALVWNGSQSNSWNDPLNWTPNIVPANGTDCTTPLSRDNVVITNSGTAPQYPGAGVYVDNFGVESGLLTISNNVRVCGSLSGGNLVGKVVGAGSIELVGSGTNIVGGLLELDKLVINKSGVGPVQIQGVLRINDLMTVTAAPGGINVGSSGNVVLVSTPSTTGKIGPIPAGTSVTVSAPGKFTQQRYVSFPSGSGGDWFFLSSPIQNKLFTDWADNFRVVGLNPGGFGSQGGDVLPSTEPERTTIFSYNEAQNNVYVDTVRKRGWVIPGAVAKINPGQGYRVFVKKEAVTLFDNQGLIHSGDKNMTITRTEAANCQTGVTSSTISACTEDWRGWNLLGNPYPCDIDWDATGAAWTKPAQMQNAWHRWNSAGQGYGLYTNGVGYVGAGPAPANPNVIPSSQAFFVKAATPGAYSATLAVKETAKITNTSGQFARVNAASQKLRIGISKSMNPADYGYDAVIRFMPEATDGYDFTYDFASLGGNNFSLGVPVDQSLLAVASFAPISDSKIVPISISYKSSVGNFFLKFSQMETLLEDNSIFLRDNLIGSIMEVTPGFVYNYQVTSTDGLTGDRFELIFNPTVVTGVNPALAAGAGINVFPNPNAIGKSTNVALRGFDVNAADVVIYDALGRVVFSKEVALTNGAAQVEIKSELPAGVYTVKAVGGSLTLTQKLAVR
jgi:hypothetical protein